MKNLHARLSLSSWISSSTAETSTVLSSGADVLGTGESGKSCSRSLAVVQKSGLQCWWLPKQWFGPFNRSLFSNLIPSLRSTSLLRILMAHRAPLTSFLLIISVKPPLTLYEGLSCTNFSVLLYSICMRG